VVEGVDATRPESNPTDISGKETPALYWKKQALRWGKHGGLEMSPA
jgi:hypothetical protein